MNLQEKKIVRSIEGAFLKLRAKKPLENITVRERVEMAEVGKSTFYRHYKDVYDYVRSDANQCGSKRV